MVGTLTVQNLQGPSSGGNANKVIIPSGQTLDASGGTLVPSAGQVVQIQRSLFNNQGVSTSSTTFVDLASIYVDITPKYDNSLLLWETAFYANLNDPDGYGRYRVVDGNNSDAVLHSNTYCAASNFYAHASGLEQVPIRAMGVSGTTSTMRLQLQVFVDQGGTLAVNWSGSDQRVVTVTEIKQ